MTGSLARADPTDDPPNTLSASEVAGCAFQLSHMEIPTTAVASKPSGSDSENMAVPMNAR
jgi:hypothetical protein